MLHTTAACCMPRIRCMLYPRCPCTGGAAYVRLKCPYKENNIPEAHAAAAFKLRRAHRPIDSECSFGRPSWHSSLIKTPISTSYLSAKSGRKRCGGGEHSTIICAATRAPARHPKPDGTTHFAALVKMNDIAPRTALTSDAERLKSAVNLSTCCEASFATALHLTRIRRAFRPSRNQSPDPVDRSARSCISALIARDGSAHDLRHFTLRGA